MTDKIAHPVLRPFFEGTKTEGDTVHLIEMHPGREPMGRQCKVERIEEDEIMLHWDREPNRVSREKVMRVITLDREGFVKGQGPAQGPLTPSIFPVSEAEYLRAFAQLNSLYESLWKQANDAMWGFSSDVQNRRYDGAVECLEKTLKILKENKYLMMSRPTR